MAGGTWGEYLALAISFVAIAFLLSLLGARVEAAFQELLEEAFGPQMQGQASADEDEAK